MDYTGATPAGLAGGRHLSASPDPQHLSSLAGQPTPPFRLDPLRAEEDRFATAQLIQAFLDLSPEILEGEEPKLVPVLEQPESFPNHLIFRSVETTGDLVVDQALELRGQRDVHCEFLCWFVVGHSVPPVGPSNAQRRPQLAISPLISPSTKSTRYKSLAPSLVAPSLRRRGPRV